MWSMIKLRFSTDALPGGEQNRCETIIAPVSSSVSQVFLERRCTFWISKTKLCASGIKTVINADQHVAILRQR